MPYLNYSEVEKKEVAIQIADYIGADVVSIIGRTIILYKESMEKPNISLELKNLK